MVNSRSNVENQMKDHTADILWKFGRDEIDYSSFAEWLYQSKTLQNFLGEYLYSKLLFSFCSGYSETYNDLRKEVLNFMRDKNHLYCECSAWPSAIVVPMGHEKQYGFDKFKIIKFNTPLSYISRCTICNTLWYIFDEPDGADYHCKRLNELELIELDSNIWPDLCHIDLDWQEDSFILLKGCTKKEWQLKTNEPSKYIAGLLAESEKLDLSSSMAADIDLENISKFKHLKYLDLSYTKISDELSEVIGSLHELVSINLSHTNITDITFAAIAKIPTLQYIILDKTFITGDLNETLCFSKNVENMSFYSTNFNDNGMKLLSECISMKSLSLTDTKITDTGLNHIKTLINLEEVNLAGMPLTDAGIATLTNMRKLQKCSLVGTNITEKSIGILSKLTNLEFIGLRGTKISESKYQQIKNIIPSLKEIY
jgi:Leucine-rich repeat (LRR) protein